MEVNGKGERCVGRWNSIPAARSRRKHRGEHDWDEYIILAGRAQRQKIMEGCGD